MVEQAHHVVVGVKHIKEFIVVMSHIVVLLIVKSIFNHLLQLVHMIIHVVWLSACTHIHVVVVIIGVFFVLHHHLHHPLHGHGHVILHVVVITVGSGLVIVIAVLVLLILLHHLEELVHQTELAVVFVVVPVKQGIDSFVRSSELGK